LLHMHLLVLMLVFQYQDGGTYLNAVSVLDVVMYCNEIIGLLLCIHIICLSDCLNSRQLCCMQQLFYAKHLLVNQVKFSIITILWLLILTLLLYWYVKKLLTRFASDDVKSQTNLWKHFKLCHYVVQYMMFMMFVSYR